MEKLKHKFFLWILSKITVENCTVDYGGHACRKLETRLSLGDSMVTYWEEIKANGSLHEHYISEDEHKIYFSKNG